MSLIFCITRQQQLAGIWLVSCEDVNTQSVSGTRRYAILENCIENGKRVIGTSLDSCDNKSSLFLFANHKHVINFAKQVKCSVRFTTGYSQYVVNENGKMNIYGCSTAISEPMSA